MSIGTGVDRVLERITLMGKGMALDRERQVSRGGGSSSIFGRVSLMDMLSIIPSPSPSRLLFPPPS